MNEQNHSEIGQALNYTLRQMLAPFVAQNLKRHYANRSWWRWGVLDLLYENQKRSLPADGTDLELTDKLDVQLCLLLIDLHWDNIFSKRMPPMARIWIRELRTIRNMWAHEVESFDDATTLRALDTMRLVAETFDEEIAEKLRAMWLARLQPKKPVDVDEKISVPTLGVLKPWRDVMEPRPDVAQGRYRQAEFAADLAQVVRGEGGSEYTDPVEFFSRTYLTGGLKKLLVETLKRLSTGAGEPIIQLKTSFGGGKTHSLLALYHLFGGNIRPEQSSAVREVLNAAGVEFLPQVQTAVIVGTWENPLQKTLWGEIAAQLSKSTGKPELYELIRANDEKKISPGVELLKKLFDAAGACLILIDELVAYGRKLSGGEITDGGTFENLLSFIQELTEAAKSSQKTALVVSVPESDIEIGGELGRRVLAQVDKIFGRVEFVWTPITEVEGYEIVRRRLFQPCRDDTAKENVCAAFFGMYVAEKENFPYESRQNGYREKLSACYPIHPKVFDYLYNKWTSLEKFQKTRGVLRLMANVVYCLWANNDGGAMIMPGSIPIYSSPVRDELAKFLGGNWDAIINAEVDGEHSKARELDGQNARFGRLAAARKIARTIFMGTSPGSRQGDVRGLPENEIRFGVIQPHEVEEISVYNDALTKLRANLYYLYSRDGRLWFGANPTLRKIFDDKREQIPDDDIEYEIEQRIKTWKGRGQFKAIYACPKNSGDVPDDQTARLIILPPKYCVDVQQNNAAFEQAKNFLDNRGTVVRRWRNTLLFMAADAEKLHTAKNFARDFLAWQSVNSDARHLNLDSLQLADAKSNLKSAAEDFAMKLSQAYCKIFAPERSEDGNLNVPMQAANIDCTKEDNISAASEKFVADEKLLGALGPVELLRWLDKFLWRDVDDIQIGKLWNYFAEYYYLPRLVDVKILLDTIRRGVASKTFGLAEDFRDGKYIEPEFGSSVCGTISTDYLLVKANVAQKQIDSITPPPIETVPPETLPPVTPTIEPAPKKILPRSFSMDVELSNTRYAKELTKYMDEIAAKIMLLPNAETLIHVDINITVPEGIPQDTQELVADICDDLKVAPENFRFEM